MRGHGQRLGTQHRPGGVQHVAAHVVGGAAAGVPREDGGVRLVARIERERARDAPYLADLAGPHDLVQPVVPRVVAVHERLGQHDPGGVGRIDHLLRLAGGDRERLLAQDVLAGGDRRQHPLAVQEVGQRDVHDIDGRVGEQLAVRPVRGRNPEEPGLVPGAADGPARDGDDLAVLGPGDRRHDRGGDPRRAEDAPAQARRRRHASTPVQSRKTPR